MHDNHGRIVALHLQDRFKNDPTPLNDKNDLPWGEAQTSIKEILRLMMHEKYTFPAFIEYNYKGQGAVVQEVSKCYDYAKAALT